MASSNSALLSPIPYVQSVHLDSGYPSDKSPNGYRVEAVKIGYARPPAFHAYPYDSCSCWKGAREEERSKELAFRLVKAIYEKRSVNYFFDFCLVNQTVDWRVLNTYIVLSGDPMLDEDDLGQVSRYEITPFELAKKVKRTDCVQLFKQMDPNRKSNHSVAAAPLQTTVKVSENVIKTEQEKTQTIPQETETARIFKSSNTILFHNRYAALGE